ncbi:MAG: hypothetical protein PHP69_07400 [Candidatus Omnitrophica bacterium]|nr:hypothetical protein [Candidatus Omnitrophota bacterium]MDD5441782.1 hypothetical protein [Candidatus Omnitrophota bacterium]
MKRYLVIISFFLFIFSFNFYGTDIVVDSDGNVGVNTTEGTALSADFEVNGTMRFTPVDSPNYAVKGSLYYDDSDNAFYYHNGTAWTKLGKKFELDTATTNVKTPFHDHGSVDVLSRSCPDGYVAVGVRAYTDNYCNGNVNTGSPWYTKYSSYPITASNINFGDDCGYTGPEIQHLGLKCRKLK